MSERFLNRERVSTWVAVSVGALAGGIGHGAVLGTYRGYINGAVHEAAHRTRGERVRTARDKLQLETRGEKIDELYKSISNELTAQMSEGDIFDDDFLDSIDMTHGQLQDLLDEIGAYAQSYPNAGIDPTAVFNMKKPRN